MNQQESKNLLLSVFCVAILIIAITGIAFAIYSCMYIGKINNNITTGFVKMSYVESNTNTISINGALPVSDDIGKKQTDYFDFDILSTTVGLMTINYKIYLEKISVDNEIDEDDIKIYLEKEEGSEYKEIVKPTTFSSISNNKLLYADKFENKENGKRDFVSKYRLRMWLSDNYEIDNQSRNFKIKVNIGGYM